MPYKNKPIFWNGRYRLYKESTIFCFPTIYSIWSRFFESWYDIGWLQNRQSLCFGHFFLVLPKSGVLNPNSDFFRQWFLALKPFASFFCQKNDLLKWIFWFLCISLIEFLSTFSHLTFCGSESFMAAQCFVECWPFLRC